MTNIEMRWYETTMAAQKSMADSMKKTVEIFEAILKALKEEEK